MFCMFHVQYVHTTWECGLPYFVLHVLCTLPAVLIPHASSLQGVGTKAVTLCLEDLKKRFLKREAKELRMLSCCLRLPRELRSIPEVFPKVCATLQCGGNRRSELDQIEKTSGIPWGFGAMSTASWRSELCNLVQPCIQHLWNPGAELKGGEGGNGGRGLWGCTYNSRAKQRQQLELPTSDG